MGLRNLELECAANAALAAECLCASLDTWPANLAITGGSAAAAAYPRDSFGHHGCERMTMTTQREPALLTPGARGERAATFAATGPAIPTAVSWGGDV